VIRAALIIALLAQIGNSPSLGGGSIGFRPAVSSGGIATCEPCWDEPDMVIMASGEGCPVGFNPQCTNNGPGAVSFILFSCDPGGGPPPENMATLVLNSPQGSCSFDKNGAFYASLSDVPATQYTDTETDCVQSLEEIDILAGFDPCA